MVRGVIAAAICALLAWPLPSAAQFLAPTPEGQAQPAPQQGRTKGGGNTQRQARPASECETMTRDWVDFRPVLDLPAAQGRASGEQQVAAVSVCEAEQAARPTDKRIAFIFARTLEVNNKGSRSTPLFRQLADANFAPAMTQLARAYHYGLGVAPDPVQACDLYVKAAKAGDAWAYNPAADCLSFQDYTHDPRLACRYFKSAQAKGTFQTTDLSQADYCP